MEWDDNVELWLGEAKFYVNYKKPVDDVLGKISYSLSDEYVHDNFLALIDWQAQVLLILLSRIMKN